MKALLDYAKDQFVQIGALNIRYRSLGEGRQTVILIHGLATSLEHWYQLVPKLIVGYRIIALDLPGFGYSEKPRIIYSVDFYIKFLMDFIMKLKLYKLNFIGHSFGGGLALKFALDHPELVDRLILLSSAGFSRHVGLLLRLFTIPGLRRLFIPISYRARAIDCGLKMLMYHKNCIEPKLVRRMRDIFRLPGFHHAFFSILDQGMNFFGIKPSLYQSIHEALPSLKVPSLVFWGEEDSILPFKWQYGLNELPLSQVYLLRKCGHLSYLECPDFLGNKISEFLANQELRY